METATRLERSTILEIGTRNWWAFVVRGLFAVLFGAGALVWPGLTLLVLVTLFGVYAIADGIVAIAGGFKEGWRVRWSLVFWGLVSIAAGIVAFAWPELTALALVYVISAWAVVTGAFQLTAAISLRKEIEGEWLLGFAGVLSILFGAALAIFPGSGALSLVWLIGTFAIVLGGALVSLGVRLRGWGKTMERAAPTHEGEGPEALRSTA